MIDDAFLSQGGALFAGPNPYFAELVQTEHFTVGYMFDFIDWNEQRGIYYTIEDFYPDGLP